MYRRVLFILYVKKILRAMKYIPAIGTKVLQSRVVQ